jgi:hypothetical protein
MHRTTDILVVVLIIAGYAALVIWTARRVWLVPVTDPSLWFGVRVFGPLLWLATTIIWSLAERHPANLLLRLAINAFWAFPPSLWSGYFAGRRMRGVVRGSEIS